MKKIICICLLTFASCFLQAQSARFISAKWEFSLQPPPQWAVMPSGMASVVVSYADQKGGSLDVVVEEKLKTTSSASYQQQNLRMMKEETEDFRLIKDGKTTVSGLPAAWMLYVEGEKQVLEYYFVFKGKGLIFSGSAPASGFKNYETTFRQTAESFRQEKTGKNK
jgi:hypothetical protein